MIQFYYIAIINVSCINITSHSKWTIFSNRFFRSVRFEKLILWRQSSDIITYFPYCLWEKYVFIVSFCCLAYFSPSLWNLHIVKIVYVMFHWFIQKSRLIQTNDSFTNRTPPNWKVLTNPSLLAANQMRETFVNSYADLRHFLFHANLTKMAPVRVDRRPVLIVKCVLFFVLYD